MKARLLLTFFPVWSAIFLPGLLLASLTLHAQTVPYTSDSLVIDGVADPAYSPVLGEMDYDPEDQVVMDPSDLHGTWQAAFDGDNLYILVQVTDDVWVSNLPNAWENDGVELFLDGDNSKGGSTDLINDIKVAFIPQADGSVVVDTNVWPQNPPGLDFSAVEAAFRETLSDSVHSGYVLELKIPLNLPDIHPQEGWEFGIDFQLNDSDSGEIRDHLITLSGAVPNNRPDRYATATLGELPDLIPVTGVSVVPDFLRLVVGESGTLEALVSPSTATTRTVLWSSLDTSVATVNAAGQVTGIGEGQTSIRATTEDGGYTAEATVLVLVQDSFAETIQADGLGTSGTYQSDWFGAFEEMAGYSGWIRHSTLGWIHAGLVVDPESMWLWSEELHAWIFTGRSLFPYVWVDLEGWSYFGSGHRFDYGLERWLRIRKPSHPYLFFTSEDVAQIREDLQRPELSQARVNFMARASGVLNSSPPSPDDVARTNLANCAIAAFAYIVTGEAQYADRAIEEVMDMAEQPDLWTTPGFDAWNRGADLESSERSLGAALVYDWCYDQMTPEERITVRDAILERGLEPYFLSINPALSPNWWLVDPINNWRGVCNGGSIVAALALYFESDLARRCAILGREHVADALEVLQLIDSGGHEGVDYNNYGIEFALNGGVALQRFFGGFEDLLTGMADEHLGSYWGAYLYAPDNRYANFGRMPINWSSGGPASMRAALYDSLAPGGDRLMRWAADNGSQRFYWNGANPFNLLWRRRGAPLLSDNDKPQLQEAVLFRGAGHAVLQSHTIWLGYSGGLAWNRGDVGAFVLLARLGDSWERLISLEPSLDDNNLESAAQSTYLVDGSGQVRGEFGRSGDYLRFGSGSYFHYFASDISDLYAVAGLNRMVRHFVMMHGRYLVILDDLAGAQSRAFEARFQTSSSNQVVLDGNSATIQGSAYDLYIVRAGFDNFSIGQGSIGSLKYVRFRRTDFQGALLTVLYPLGDGDLPPVVNVADGVVEIIHGELTDTLTFIDTAGGWELSMVNGQSVEGIGTGDDRNIIPVRESRPDAQERPSWILDTVR